MTDLNEMFNIPTPIEWDDVQQKAINACCDVSKRIVAITGKAGTGKTVLLREVAKRLEDAGYTVQASAPTGKAAKRINEATGLHAMTNHRMLGYGMPLDVDITDDRTGNKKTIQVSTGPKFKSNKPMPYDTILCDEYAMVNQEIHRNLIDALKAGARICMFGDQNQLKPIEKDWKLNDQPSAFQTALAKFGGIVLDTIHRHNEGSGIATNAALVLQGRMPRVTDDFKIQQTDEPVSALQAFVELQSLEGNRYDGLDCQIISCGNKTWVGTQQLNLVIQSMFWERARPFIELPRLKKDGKDQTPIRVQIGSKVVYTANTYDLDGTGTSYAFNGEVGRVVDIDHQYGNIEIDFNDRTVIIPPLLITVRENGQVIEGDPRRYIDLAYVLTTHKMQGSEVDHVTYVLNRKSQFTQSRRNFYTAMTRARKHCTVICDTLSLHKSTKFPG